MKRVVILLVALVGVGCRTDPVQKDLLHYLGALGKILPAGDAAIKAYDDLSAKSVDAKTGEAEVDKIMTDYGKFVDEAKALKPATKDVQELHALLVQMVDKQLETFKTTRDAYHSNDRKLVDQINAAIDEAKALRTRFLDERARLAKKHRVELGK
jgi:hypothetical protein